MNNNNYKKRRPTQKEVLANLELLTLKGKGQEVSSLASALDLHIYNDKTYEYYDALEIQTIINNKTKEMAKKTGGKTQHVNDKIYNTFINGKVAVYVKEKTETSKLVVSEKTGAHRFYEMFKDCTGKIEHIYSYDKPINDVDVEFLVIQIGYTNEAGKKVTEVIETPFKGNYANSILTKLPNIDVKEMVTLIPYNVKNKEKSAEKGKDVYNTGVKILQGEGDGTNNKVLPAYTKENPNGLPPWVEIKSTKKGVKSEWSSVEQNDFLRERMEEFNEQVKLNFGAVSEEETKALADASRSSEQADDDLPF